VRRLGRPGLRHVRPALAGRRGRRLAFAAQLLGTLAGIFWALAGGALVYGVLRATTGLRLSAEEEYDGADLTIHRIGATPDREVIW
jgi:Amt family ammonium transporter